MDQHRLYAMKHQGARTDLTSRQVGTKLRTDEQIAEGVSDSARNIQRFIRLTNLIPELLDIQSKFIRPKIRPYQTDNYYDILKRAAQAEKEVDRIVSAVQRKKK